jgi:hypothetical protein
MTCSSDFCSSEMDTKRTPKWPVFDQQTVDSAEEGYFVIGQCELNADSFSGKERNLRAQGHTPFADIYAVASNFLHVSLRMMTGIETGQRK